MNNLESFTASRRKIIAIFVAAAVAAGAGAAWHMHRTAGTAGKAERKVLYWHDPMVPGPRFDKPGKSPFMDMDLVPVYADEQPADGGVTISPRALQNLGVRITRAEAGVFPAQLEAVGVVKADEKKVQVVQSRQAGWIEMLHVRSAGETVQRDQPLVELYSPDIVAAQEELLLAKKMEADDAMLSAARTRLRLFGLSVAQISQIEASGAPSRTVQVLAPMNGVVTEVNARQGMSLAAGSALMTIADLGGVWVMVDVPESQSAWLKPNAPADVRFATLPGRIFNGTIEQVFPGLDAASRTLRARIAIDNAGGELRPEMLASVTLHGPEEASVLAVPSEAVIVTGKRNVVILAESGGRFVPVEVTTGRERDGRTEILQGLQPGQAVVASGQFLIDSESSLKAALKRFEDAPPAVAAPSTNNAANTPPHDHAHH